MRSWTASSMSALVAVSMTLAFAAGCDSRLERHEDEPGPSPLPSEQLSQWAGKHAEPYGIPERALQAYAYAAAVMDRSAPGCGIGWPTLAAIGSVMSNHGGAAGSEISPSGDVTPIQRGLNLADPAIGKERVADTDKGVWDGSSARDVPMGPMQFFPSRWEQWVTDGTNDGKATPDNIDDAALSAARFLCAVGGDLRQSEGWTKAVGQFYPSSLFVMKAHDVSVTYSR